MHVYFRVCSFSTCFNLKAKAINKWQLVDDLSPLDSFVAFLLVHSRRPLFPAICNLLPIRCLFAQTLAYTVDIGVRLIILTDAFLSL